MIAVEAAEAMRARIRQAVLKQARPDLSGRLVLRVRVTGQQTTPWPVERVLQLVVAAQSLRWDDGDQVVVVQVRGDYERRIHLQRPSSAEGVQR